MPVNRTIPLSPKTQRLIREFDAWLATQPPAEQAYWRAEFTRELERQGETLKRELAKRGPR
jgi:hypothetical protein